MPYHVRRTPEGVRNSVHFGGRVQHVRRRRRARGTLHGVAGPALRRQHQVHHRLRLRTRRVPPGAPRDYAQLLGDHLKTACSGTNNIVRIGKILNLRCGRNSGGRVRGGTGKRFVGGNLSRLTRVEYGANRSRSPSTCSGRVSCVILFFSRSRHVLEVRSREAGAHLCTLMVRTHARTHARTRARLPNLSRRHNRFDFFISVKKTVVRVSSRDFCCRGDGCVCVWAGLPCGDTPFLVLPALAYASERRGILRETGGELGC